MKSFLKEPTQILRGSSPFQSKLSKPTVIRKKSTSLLPNTVRPSLHTLNNKRETKYFHKEQ